MARNLLLILVSWVAVFFAGWVCADWKRDSDTLLIERAATAAGNQARQEAQTVASNSGRQLEQKLEDLKGALPASIRAEVVKPVFINDCLSADYVRMFNDAMEKSERTLSGKPEN
ncbi:TPA: hypothetical protein MAR16_005161 [Klebsiella pneumoniae]|nr:hypothetical protein [Klebsiella pneumoniae]